ncbi:class I SAM-dependent methyltransferase [Maribellus sp. YY47]|uniref:class I SAM-dependent methyltransferase n=1 Tax=Maribellus sp. YY47 TaxID=2929486 RepID=UPI002001CE97|nr:class I SAM-dependent methyltransferase [Maribellus sp. YY47]MCK3683842.1 class I SAM-dependent methyltransferase [Maribellus sp. YY47]
MKRPKILHIAPEYSLFRILKKLDAEYVDGDIDPAYARNVVDITAIHYPDNYFDLIICSHVLGHVPDEAKAVKELYRVLSPGGEAIIMSVLALDSRVTLEDSKIVSPKDRLARYGERDLCRLHGLDFQERLEAGGFNVETIDYRTHFTAAENAKFRMGDGKRELIFSCIK